MEAQMKGLGHLLYYRPITEYQASEGKIHFTCSFLMRIFSPLITHSFYQYQYFFPGTEENVKVQKKISNSSKAIIRWKG